MAESVVSGVVTRLGDLLLQEAIYLYGVSDKANELQTELTRMQCYLKDADARQNESAFVKNSVAEMKDLAYDAEDVIATYALTVGSRKGRGIQKVLKRCACILDEGITAHQFGLKIDVIKTRISNLKQSFQEYGIEQTRQAGGSSSFDDMRPEQRETYSHLQHDVVGFDNDLNELVEFLLKEEEDKRVASIWGMGGLGKTTLAKMVYNDTKVKQHFDCFAWVCISQQCQKIPVWVEILVSLDSNYKRDQIKEWSDPELVKELLKVQQNQKCLVVLDDIWKIEDWEILCEVFPLTDTRSKILLTSRIRDVAFKADPRGFHHELGCLNPAKSWVLLEKLAISCRPDSEIEPFMKELGEDMIGYCGGLPLAITVLGGLLATKKREEEWVDVHKHVKSYLREERDLRVNKVLALSYNDLPSHLKPCFLYLGHFPEDFEIPTKELIRMWMGEGFISQIQHRGGRGDTMDDVGDRYLRELVQRCMVLVGKVGSLGRIKTCRMHDLMRDFCVSKAQDENFLSFTNTLSMKQREAQISKVRRLAIIPISLNNILREVKFNEYPYLRSLLYLPKNELAYFKESRFKKFKLVRVLHLEYFKNHLRKLPKDTGCLIHLRYLSLKGSNINEVPSSIGNLRCLETLDLQIISKPRVPNVFKYMKQLKHLYLPWRYRVCCKLELGNLSYLQTLVNVQPKTIQIPEWFELNRLRVLKVRCNFWAPEVMEELILRCRLVEKLNFYCYMWALGACLFSRNLVKLTLCGTCLEKDPMPDLGKLPKLKILRFLGGDRFELGPAFSGEKMFCSKGGFPLLQYLHLHSLIKLEEWGVEEGAMPRLCHLEIRCCMNLTSIPDGLRFISTLRELVIYEMPRSFKDRLEEGGQDFDKVKHVPSREFHYCDGE